MPTETEPRADAKPSSRIHLVTACILGVGWTTAAIIYATATPDEDNPLDEFEQSKRYFLDIEKVGGKTAVFSRRVSEWFSTIWHGQSLAITIAVLTAIVALAYLFIASRLAATE